MCRSVFQLWLNICLFTDSVYLEKPTEQELDIISKNIGKEWKSLLIQLGIPSFKIDQVTERMLRDPVAVTCRCLISWLNGEYSNSPYCKPCNWCELLNAIEEGAEQKDYAATLREDLKKRQHEPEGQL